MKKTLAMFLAISIVLMTSSFGLAEEKPSTWLVDEKATLKVTTYDAVNNSYPTIDSDLPFWKWLEEYTNVHVEFEAHAYADYPTVVSTKMASGDLNCDIIVTNGVATANDAGKNGLLADAAPYLEACWPNITKFNNEENPSLMQFIKNDDGSIYCISGLVEPRVGHIIYMYNTEWMEKLGLEIPTTTEEFYNVCAAMKQAGDLNGNGKDDEIVLTASGLDALDILGNSFGLEIYEDWDAFVADENGTVTDEYTSPEMREFLKFTNKLYKDGLLDQGITNTSANEMSEKIASDQVGIFVYYSAFAITYGSLTTAGQADPMGCHYTLGVPLTGPNGDRYLVRREKSDMAAGVAASSQNVELALKWIDTLYADPTVLHTRTYGFEGEDWKYGADGGYELIYAEDGSPWSIVQKGCGQIAFPFIQTEAQLMNSKKQYDWYMNQYAVLTDEKNDYFIAPTVPHVAAYTEEEQNLIDMVKTDCVSYFKEMRAKFVTGEANLDSDWDSYVSTMKSMGLDDFTAVYQSVYDRTR